MTCRGHIQNGTIVLDDPTNLPDGTQVEVQVTPLKPVEGPPEEQSIEELTKDVSYDFDAFWRLREVSKM